MIFGVTHDHEGTPLKRATIGYKLSIGLPPVEGRNHPQRLDHFIVTVKTSKAGGWEEDKAFTAQLKEKYRPEGATADAPFRELDVILLSDDPEEIFRSEYAWRTQTQLKCHGDGQNAVRRFSELHPDDQADSPGAKPNDWIEIGGCGKGCPQLEQGLCKPSGDLYFMFPERPTLGSVALLHTSGYESVKRIYSSLLQIKQMVGEHGGSLKGLQLKLVARPYKTSFTTSNGDRKSSSQLAFNLEFRQSDHRKLLPALVQQSREMQKDIGEAIDVEVLNEDEAAATIGPEFHPTDEQKAEQEKAEAAAKVTAEVKQAAKRPRILDHVVDQKPAAAAPAPANAAEIKAKLESAKTIDELNTVAVEAKGCTDVEQKDLREVYKKRYAAFSDKVPAGWREGQPEVQTQAQPPAEPAKTTKAKRDII